MSPRKLFVALLAASALVATGVNPFAQSAGPQPSAMPAPTPAPRDVPYPGTIRLRVDATDIERHIFSVNETIPVRGAGKSRSSIRSGCLATTPPPDASTSSRAS